MKKCALIMLVFLTISCSGTQSISEQTGIDTIVFGSGGGFTGQEITYTLSANSTLSSAHGVLKKIPEKETLSLFKRAEKLLAIDYRTAGNIYSFIRIKTANTQHQIVWKARDPKVDEAVTQLFDDLQLLTK